MKKKKLTLENLEVKSFLTGIEDKQNYVGGWWPAPVVHTQGTYCPPCNDTQVYNCPFSNPVYCIASNDQVGPC